MIDFNQKSGLLLQSGYRYALSLTHRESDAEDLVQEAWLKVYPKKGRRINRPLLFTAIRNLYIDHYRRGQLVVFEAFDETQQSPVELTENNITSADLEAALDRLKPEEREAIFLNAVEGYTAQEIADLTDRPRNTVLSLMHRGKQKLSKALNALSGRNQA